MKILEYMESIESMDFVKKYLKVDSDEDDDIINKILRATEDFAENVLSTILTKKSSVYQ